MLFSFIHLFFFKTDLSHLILRSLLFLLVHLQNLRIYTPTTWSQVASHAVEKHPPHRQHNIQYERTTLSHRKCHSLRRIMQNAQKLQYGRNHRHGRCDNTAGQSHIRRNHQNTAEHQCHIRSGQNAADWNKCHTINCYTTIRKAQKGRHILCKIL